MNNNDTQPDWNTIAEKFDLWLPLLAPVGETLLSTLQTQEGDLILDLASGTGEPAITLAQHFSGNVTITGIDAAAGMVKVAQNKISRAAVTNISFQCMSAEQLSFPDNTFDRALCRFGVMLFEDPLQGLREMYRTLKPGGRFAFSVWGTPENMTTMYWAYNALKDRLPEDNHPPLAKATSLGHPGILTDLLQQAGFDDYAVDSHVLEYEFSSFAEYWALVESSEILKTQYNALSTQQRIEVKAEIQRYATSYMQNERLVIPHQYLLASGFKSYT